MTTRRVKMYVQDCPIHGTCNISDYCINCGYYENHSLRGVLCHFGEYNDGEGDDVI